MQTYDTLIIAARKYLDELLRLPDRAEWRFTERDEDIEKKASINAFVDAATKDVYGQIEVLERLQKRECKLVSNKEYLTYINKKGLI